MGVVRDQIIFDGEAKLQGETDHEAWAGHAEHAERLALRMRKKNHPERVFASLQAHGRQIVDLCLFEYLLEAGEGARGAYRKRFRHLADVADGEESSLPVGQVADVFARAAPVAQRGTVIDQDAHLFKSFRLSILL